MTDLPGAIRILLGQPGYRRRQGQIDLMEAVHQTLGTPGRQLVVEAPTGTGKTEGLLVPALMATVACRACGHAVDSHSSGGGGEVGGACACGCREPDGLRVAIATHSNLLAARSALDAAPRLESILGLQPRTVLAKGRSNYLCLERLYRYAPTKAQAEQIDEQAQSVGGDLDRMGAGGEFRSAVCDRPRYCLGTACSYANRCYSVKARELVKTALVVVTTQAFLMADIRTGQRMLGEYGVVLLDEAQHVAEVATSALSSDLSSDRLRLLGQRRSLPTNLAAAASDAAAAIQTLSNTPRIDLESVILDKPPKRVRDALGRLEDAAEAVVWANVRGEARIGLAQFVELAEQASIINSSWASEGMVLHASQRESVITLGASPLGVAGYLRRELYFSEKRRRSSQDENEDDDATPGAPQRQPRSVVAVSATLRSTGEPDGFGYFLSRTGLRGARTMTVASPFSTARAAIYLPRSAPDAPPNGAVSLEFANSVVTEALSVQVSVGGGMLVLCTSWAWLHAIEQALQARVSEGQLFVQADGGSADALLNAFLSGPTSSILVGTKRFWEGVDVPGERIRTVVVPRLPFGNPNGDVLLRARFNRAEARGRGMGFAYVLLPEMLITLRQGAGRLVRTESDWGVILIYDNRCARKSYGPTVRRALRYGVATSAAQVERFAAGLRESARGG